MTQLNSVTETEFTQLKKQIGSRIQTLRKEKGITQEKLAEAAGLDRVGVGYIEQGVRAARLRSLLRIAKVLGCEVRELFN